MIFCLMVLAAAPIRPTLTRQIDVSNLNIAKLKQYILTAKEYMVIQEVQRQTLDLAWECGRKHQCLTLDLVGHGRDATVKQKQIIRTHAFTYLNKQATLTYS
jgi:hypothetical protein